MGSTESFDAATKTATIAITFDVDALRAISDVNFTGTNETKPDYFMFTGFWAGNTTGSLGLANNGSSTSDTTGVWSSWVKGTSKANNTDAGLGSVFTSATNWENIDSVALVYSYSTPETGATTTNVALSIGYTDGSEITTYGNTKSNIVFNGISGFAATGVTINDTYVTSYDVSNVYSDLDTAKTMSAALISSQAIPEPTTATLSLLALAGLAARRRRKQSVGNTHYLSKPRRIRRGFFIYNEEGQRKHLPNGGFYG